ncbi:hypothetical protein Mapa_017487 [Marchantia paleacea]|nr:hypothetical protein Mapa_017487 [Marchantia paleacea]
MRSQVSRIYIPFSMCRGERVLALSPTAASYNMHSYCICHNVSTQHRMHNAPYLPNDCLRNRRECEKI